MQQIEGIPAFLRLTPAERAANWRGRRLTTMNRNERKADYSVPRSIDAAGRAILKERARAQAERLKGLNKRRRRA